MKQLLRISILAIVLTVIPKIAAAFSGIPYMAPTGQTLYFDSIDSRSVWISSYYNYYNSSYNVITGSLVIPSSISYRGQTYIVTGIGDFAFSGARITSVTIPESVTYIGFAAFSDCSSLTGSLTIPNSVTYIGGSAFEGCSGLTGSLTIPNSVTSIGDYAFHGCSGFTGSLTIPNSVTSIGDHAFYGCSGFNGSLTIPNSVTHIGDNAFEGCSGFTGSLTIPNSVTYIGGSAFYGCSGFTGSLTIPNSVTSIGDMAFYNCSGFTGSLTIPNSVTYLGGGAFAGCSGFTGSLTIGNSVDTIHWGTFSNCSGFTGTLTIGNSVIYIEDGPFFYGAFANDSLFSTLSLGGYLTYIGDYAFYGCSGFTGSLTIPNSVTYLGGGAFSGCSGFTGSLTIPNSVTYLGGGAFSGCSGFTGSLTIPNMVTFIDKNAFYGCHGLTGSLTIPNSVTHIGGSAFYGCSGISSLIIGSSVDTIGGYAFCDGGITKVVSFAATPPALGRDVFVYDDGTTSVPLYVPCGTENDYRAAYGWSGFQNVYGSRGCFNAVCSTGQQLNYSINCTSPDVTLIGYEGSCSGSLAIPTSVTHDGTSYPVAIIGDYAFFNCTGLSSVTIPTSVNTIRDFAFALCRELTGSLTIPASVTSIGMAPWAGCNGITSIDVESGNRAYNSRNNCNAIIHTASNNLIQGCNSTRIPNNVSAIDNYAFYQCNGLTGSLSIPNSVTTIGHYAFDNCTGLSGTLTIPNSVTAIGNFAFRNCNLLSNIVIGDAVTYLGGNAFAWCTGLQSLTCLASVPPTLGNILVFYNVPWSIPLYVPCGSEAAYSSATIWNNFTIQCTSTRSFLVIASPNDTAMGSVLGGATYASGATATLTGTANRGHRFVRWSNNETNNPLTITVTQDTTLIAFFAPDTFVVAGMADNTSMGSVSGGGRFAYGDSVILSATANCGYRFSSWSDGCSDNPRLIVVSSDTTIYARYETYIISSGDTITVCDSCTWHGRTFTASTDTATYRTTNAAGCDSTVTLNLTINRSTRSNETATACNIFTWHGRTFSASTDTATYRTTNAAGCDSTATLHLTINQCSTTETTACDSYTWHGTAYTTSGTYTSGTDTLVLTINHSTTGTETVTACNSYTWNGRAFSASTDTATYRTTNAAGCDSIVTLNLTVNYSTAAIDSYNVCDSLLWYNDVLYTESNSTDTIHRTNYQGCDSLVTLDLTVRYSTTAIDSYDVCDSLRWYNDVLYTEPNSTDTIHRFNAAGCDSLVTLDLTVRHSTTATDSYDVCDSLRWWNGVLYTMDNSTDTIHRVNAAGCDSVVTLNLTVNYSTTGSETVTACNMYVWHGMTLAANADTAYHTTNAAGCDSTVTLHLTINQCATTEVTVCDSLTWNGTLYTESGTYTHGSDSLILTVNYSTAYTLTDTACNSYSWHSRTFTASTDTATYSTTNVAGCDSVVTLHLTINHDSITSTTVTAANSYAWHDNTYTTSGTYIHRYTTVHGCSGTDTLHLTITAAQRYFTVRAASANNNMGSAMVVGSSRVQQGAQATVRATANSGYRFVRWSNGSTANPYTFTVTRDTLLTAYFEGSSYTVTVVNGNPGRGIVTGSGTATYGSRRNISASPNHGYSFSHWDDGDTNAHRTITVTGNITLTAYFDVHRFLVRAAAADSTHGTVTGGGTYNYQSVATLTATPNTGYAFDRWSDGDTVNPRRVTVTSDTAFTAIFRAVPVTPTYTVTVVSANPAMGSVSGGGSYEEGTVATITARANSGYEFDSWTDGVTSNPRSVTILSDTTFTATFRAVYVPQDYTVTITSNNANFGRVSGSGTYREGSTAYISAYPSAHCHFVRWSDGNATAQRTLTVTSDITLTATFAPDSVEIVARANDGGLGRVAGGGLYAIGDEATLTATPNSGSRFLRWSTGEREQTITITVRSAFTYTAIFERTTQGIDEAEGESMRVWSHGLTIHVAGLTGEPLKVYDVTGRLVAERTAAHDDMVIPVAHPSLYLVQTGTVTHKVLTR